MQKAWSMKGKEGSTQMKSLFWGCEISFFWTSEKILQLVISKAWQTCQLHFILRKTRQNTNVICNFWITVMMSCRENQGLIMCRFCWDLLWILSFMWIPKGIYSDVTTQTQRPLCLAFWSRVSTSRTRTLMGLWEAESIQHVRGL